MSEFKNSPDKNSSNMLAYFGARKFDIKFFALYLVSAVILTTITNFLLDGGQMPAGRLPYVVIIGLLIGTGLYFWDLKKAQKAE